MPRKYTKIKEPEVFQMKAERKTNREIAERFGLTREQIRGLIQHHNRNEENVICQRQKGAVHFFIFPSQPQTPR